MTEDLGTTRPSACSPRSAGLGPMFLEQLYTFGRIGRDPRTRVMSASRITRWSMHATFDRGIARNCASGDSGGELLVASLRPVEAKRGGDPQRHSARGRRSTRAAKSVDLAFDHADILAPWRLARLRGKIEYAPVGYQLLPELFTLLDLQQLHETVLGRRREQAFVPSQNAGLGRSRVGAGQLQRRCGSSARGALPLCSQTFGAL